MNARLWPIFGIAAVAAMWAASAYANFLAGMALTDEAHTQWVLGFASVASDVLKGAALFMIVALAGKRHWVATSVAVVIFALCTTWSLRSAVYFAASAMDSKVARIEAQNKIAETKLKVLDLKSQRAEFLSGQSVEVNVNNKFARKDALTANQETSQEFRELVSEVEQGVKELEKATFVQAAVDPIAANTGLDPKTVILFSSIFFALLLEMGSSWGFWIIARARTHPAQDPAPEVAIVPEVSPPAPKTIALGFGGVPVEISPSPAPETATRTKEIPKAETSRTETISEPDNVLDVDEGRVTRALSLVLEAAPGERVLMSNLGVRLNEVLPPLHRLSNQHRVSAAVTKNVHKVIPGASKEKIAGQMWVVNVRLRSANESVSIARSK